MFEIEIGTFFVRNIIHYLVIPMSDMTHCAKETFQLKLFSLLKRYSYKLENLRQLHTYADTGTINTKNLYLFARIFPYKGYCFVFPNK